MIALPTETRTQPSTGESEVLRQFTAGDLGAFEILFRQHQAQVYGWIVRVVRDAGAAEDLTLETFWRIYRARERFDAERSFEAWARRIATNLAIDHLKRVRPMESLPADCARAVEVDRDMQEDVRRQTERAFRQLPAGYQAVAMLALVEGATLRGDLAGGRHLGGRREVAGLPRGAPVAQETQASRSRTMK